MKKLVLTLGLACLFMVACNNTPKQAETQPAEQPVEQPAAETTEVVEEKQDCPMHALKDGYANWDNLTEEQKAELNKKAAAVFAEMDAKMDQMKAEGKECTEECAKKLAEMTDEQKAEFEAKKAECEAKCAEMKAKWENFANLTVEEQKALIMERLEGCNHEGEKGCCNHEGK